MSIPIYQVDAFTDRLFAGNPAAVMVFDSFPIDSILQSLAAENSVSETAFLVAENDGYALRWFTPTREISLCGHGTLASGAVVMERLDCNRHRVSFRSASGMLHVERTPNGYALDLPARRAHRASALVGLDEALRVTPAELFLWESTCMAVMHSSEEVRALTPNMIALAAVEIDAVIVTAAGQQPYDFISRYFAPACGIDEDPVTGSAHCTLVPYWAERLQKNSLTAFQASRRGGRLQCRNLGERIRMEGSCVFYMEGTAASP